MPPFSWDGKTLNWVQRGLLPRAYSVQIAQPSTRWLRMTVEAHPPLTARERRALPGIVRRVLNLDLDVREFHALAKRLNPRIAKLVARGGGRLLRGTTLFEDLVKTLCTTNASWEHTTGQVRRIIERYGQAGSSGRAFPVASDMLRASEFQLREHCRVGYRAPYLLGVVKRCAALESNGVHVPVTADDLLQVPLRGFGPYASAHVRVLLNDYHQVPWDCEVKRFAAKYLGIKSRSDQQARNALEMRYASWDSWRFLAFKAERKILKANWIGD